VRHFIHKRIWLQIRPAWRPWIVPLWSVMILVFGWQLYSAATLSAAATNTTTGELADRTAMKAGIKVLFEREAFNQIDKVAGVWRVTKAETASGVRKLAIFYEALHEQASTVQRRDNAGWDALFAKLARWQKQAPDSPAAIIATAMTLKRQAWTERPRSWIVDISDAGDQQFVARLDMARRYLEKNAVIAMQDPHYFVILAELATAQSDDMDRLVEIIDRGLILDPGYHKIATAGLDYFAPAQSADPAAHRRLQAFANSMARLPDGDALYARLYWHAVAAGYGKSAGFEWNKVLRGMDALLARRDVAWNRENLARLACQAGDLATAHRLLVPATGTGIEGVWPTPALRAGCAGGVG
jgi:hypothetical protein